MGWELQSIGVHIGSKIAEENKIYFTTNKYIEYLQYNTLILVRTVWKLGYTRSKE